MFNLGSSPFGFLIQVGLEEKKGAKKISDCPEQRSIEKTRQVREFVNVFRFVKIAAALFINQKLFYRTLNASNALHGT